MVGGIDTMEKGLPAADVDSRRIAAAEGLRETGGIQIGDLGKQFIVERLGKMLVLGSLNRWPALKQPDRSAPGGKESHYSLYHRPPTSLALIAVFSVYRALVCTHPFEWRN